MSDDWQPGDLALKIRVFAPAPLAYQSQLQIGGVYRVAKVLRHADAARWGAVGLQLDGIADAGAGWNSNGFRKIRPHTPDAEDEATIRLLTGKPVHLPA